MQIPNDVMPLLVAKAKEMLDGYDGTGIDTWDAVVDNDTDGYDINVHQEGDTEPLRVSVYKVTNTYINTREWVDISKEVMK